MGFTVPPVVQSTEAAKLVLTKTAGENISALKIVRLTASDNYVLADEVTYNEALAIGVALNAASTGQQVRALTLGILEDAFFTFPLNTLLYLGSNGTITDTVPATHRVRLGYSLGPGAIFVKIEEPIIL